MDDALKILFGRQLDDEEEAGEKDKKKAAEFRAPSGFNPSDPYYNDPQLRLKHRLRNLFPHLPFLPGLPPRQDDK